MKPYQELLLRVKVNLGVRTIKEYSTILIDQNGSLIIRCSLVSYQDLPSGEGLTPLQEM